MTISFIINNQFSVFIIFSSFLWPFKSTAIAKCSIEQNRKYWNFPWNFELSCQELSMCDEMERSNMLVKIRNRIFHWTYRKGCHLIVIRCREDRMIQCISNVAHCSRWRDRWWSIYWNIHAPKASHPFIHILMQFNVKISIENTQIFQLTCNVIICSRPSITSFGSISSR